MDFEALLQRIEKLESQLKSVTKTLSNQHNQIGGLEDNSTQILERFRGLKNDSAKLTSSLNNLGNYDTTITKLRVDVKRQIEESENRSKLNLQMLEKLHDNHLQSLDEKINASKVDSEKKFDQKLNMFIEENQRLIQQFKETNSSVESFLSSGIKGNISFFQQELVQNKKIIESLSHQFDTNLQRMDDFRARQESIRSDLKTNQSRLTEMVATENERKQTFINFMEQQTLTNNERDRTWSGWQEHFDEIKNQMDNLLPELQKKQIELNQLSKSFEVITEKIERRINEVTEMYRLMDEKFRQEWATFRSDLEKRWTNISLVMDEKQSELLGNNKSFRDRIVRIEDETHDMREALLLMSHEIQKGMQGLLNMVNGWMDTFGQIETDK